MKSNRFFALLLALAMLLSMSALAESVTLPFTLVVCAVIGNANRSARKTVRITYMSILLLTTKHTLTLNRQI